MAWWAMARAIKVIYTAIHQPHSSPFFACLNPRSRRIIIGAMLSPQRESDVRDTHPRGEARYLIASSLCILRAGTHPCWEAIAGRLARRHAGPARFRASWTCAFFAPSPAHRAPRTGVGRRQRLETARVTECNARVRANRSLATPSTPNQHGRYSRTRQFSPRPA